MNPNPTPTQKKSTLERLQEQVLAIIVLPTWPDDIRRKIKTERTRMLLCDLIATLEKYFKGRGCSCIPNSCTIAYNSGERVTTTRGVANETIGIADNSKTNKHVEMSNWKRTDVDSELIAADFLTLLGKNRFLFLISDDNSPIKALGTLFPSLSANYLGHPGECFVCYPVAAYCEAMRLPGNKGH